MLTIDSRDLHWDKKLREFHVDASSLEMKYPVRRLDYENGRWYLHIKSHRTGQLAKFFRVREERSPDNDLMYVVFENAEHGIFLVIFND